MPEAEALALIAELSDLRHPRRRFSTGISGRWGDVLMWDNCCAQHRAIKDYAYPNGG